MPARPATKKRRLQLKSPAEAATTARSASKTPAKAQKERARRRVGRAVSLQIRRGILRLRDKAKNLDRYYWKDARHDIQEQSAISASNRQKKTAAGPPPPCTGTSTSTPRAAPFTEIGEYALQPSGRSRSFIGQSQTQNNRAAFGRRGLLAA